MNTTVDLQQEESIRSRRSALLMGSAALAGLALSRSALAQAAVTDNDILNFALNLEYLEANFYSLAVNGTTIDATLLASGDGKTPAGTITYKTSASTKVNFTTPTLAAYAAETANDELNHVKALRSTLAANAVAMPNIDLLNSFNALAQAAGLGATFDPFADETSFLLGAFIFEDVGVSAYLGAAPLISSATVLSAALDIHAVEAYHAGSIRTQIYRNGGPTGAAAMASQAIAKTRATLGATDPTTDIGVMTATWPTGAGSTIVDASVSTGRVAPRTTTQVLGVVYGGGAAGKGGAFFPNGLNGTIK